MTLARATAGELARARTATTVAPELLAADAVVARMYAELEVVEGARDELQARFPALLGDDDGEEMPEGTVSRYAELNARVSRLRTDLLDWVERKQRTLEKQILTRQKSGELVLVSTIFPTLQEAAVIGRKYVPSAMGAAYEAEMQGVITRFLQANPAALLEQQARINET